MSKDNSSRQTVVGVALLVFVGLFSGLGARITGHASGEATTGCGGSVDLEQRGAGDQLVGAVTSPGASVPLGISKPVAQILGGSQFVGVTPSDDLENIFFDLVPVSPIYRTPDRLASALPANLQQTAERYGYRAVVPKGTPRPGLPAFVILHEAVTGHGARRIVVDPASCDPTARTVSEMIAGNACSLRVALKRYCAEKYADDSGTDPLHISLRGGRYVDTDGIMDLCKGVTISNYEGETVELSSEIDLNALRRDPTPGLNHPRWRRVTELGSGHNVWALDWYDRVSTDGYGGITPPLFLGGQTLEQTFHVDARTRGGDVPTATFEELLAAPGGAYMYFAPGHASASQSTFLNPKSKCGGSRRPKYCRGGPDIERVTHSIIHDAWFSKLCPHAALRPLADQKCLVVKLPGTRMPRAHDILSADDWNGFHLRRTGSWPFEHEDIHLRGLRFHPSFMLSFINGPSPSGGVTARLDGVDVSGREILVRGGAGFQLVNSYLHDAPMFIRITEDAAGLAVRRTNIINNFMARSQGKAIYVEMRRRGYGALEGVSWSDEAEFNRFELNTVYRATAINTTGLHHWLIAHNDFSFGGVQEGILDLDGHADHVRVQQNWLYDSLGTGINLAGQVSAAGPEVGELHIVDNQFIRSPGGAGPSPDYCDRFPRDYAAGSCRNISAWAIGLFPQHSEVSRCERVRVENNLVVGAGPRQKGIWTMECDSSKVRGNSVYGDNKHGFYLASRRTAASGFEFTENVSVGRLGSYPTRLDLAVFPFYPGGDSTHPDVRTLATSDARYIFSGNLLGTLHASVCGVGTTTCRFTGLTTRQRSAHWLRLRDPSNLDFLDTRPGHPGFKYLSEKGGAAHVLPAHLAPYARLRVDELLALSAP